MADSATLTRRAAWRALKNHQASIESTHLRELFAADLQRGKRFVA
jgi:glucose-6-phosphate isomerase